MLIMNRSITRQRVCRLVVASLCCAGFEQEISSMLSRKHHPLRCWLIFCPLSIILLVACSTNSPTSSSVTRGSSPVPSSTAVPGAPLGAPGCRPPSPMRPASPQGLPETQGTATGAQLWALFFADMPIHPKQEIKIVWRMTGAGDLHLVAVGPRGLRIPPDWTQYHESSNWQRPGQEWGSGFTFPSPGCWDLHATRGTSSGDVWLVVQ
jgi:hypothetical protein